MNDQSHDAVAQPATAAALPAAGTTETAAWLRGQDAGVLTVTGLDPILRAALEAEAKTRGITLNDLVLETLSRHCGLSGTAELFRQFEQLAGMPPEQAEEIIAAMGLLDETDLFDS